VRTVAQALGVLLSEERPDEQLCHALHVRGRMLLILDNMEQVADFAASTVGTWTRKTSQAIFLVTSRVRLGLQAEQLVPLGPLSSVEALQLFEDRAKRLRPDFALNEETRPVVTQIVERLDGMSLAIELAAGRSSLMSPSQILERLDQRFRLLGNQNRDRSERQATLRGAIDWSWNLLHSGEQAALAQCSVFRGGFSLEAAERVLALEAWDGWALDLIQSLVDQSLIRRTETPWGSVRFQIYETIREYARERMVREGAVQTPRGESATGAACLEALRYRHALFFSDLGMGDRIENELRHGSRERRRAFLIESENLAASIETCLQLGRSDLLTGSVLAWTAIQLWSGSRRAAMDVLSSLVNREDLNPRDHGALLGQYSSVLSSLGRRSEAMEIVARGVELARKSGDAILLSEALVKQAHYTPKSESLDERLCLYQEAQELEIQSGSRSREALTLLNIVALSREYGELKEASNRMERALAIGHELGSALIIGKAFLLKAMHSMDIGDMESSDSYLQEALQRAREIELTTMITNVLGIIGTFTKNRGELERSIQAHEEGIRYCRAIGSRRDECLLLGNLALVVQLQGDLERAQQLYEQTIALSEEVEFGLVATMAVGNLGDLLLNQGRFEESRPHLIRAIEEMDAAQQNSAGCFRGSLAWAVAQQGDFAQARRLLKEGEPQLRDVWTYELGRLLVRRGQVERLAGDLRAADAALEEARAIALQLGSGPESDLGQLLIEVDHETTSTI
jgi:tetratricopeptide (TPR) repeat protein